ncbi:hypothetical protein N0V84_009388 [Fusarium piperis]|uniref:Uncharacterized protein n=1 Tax=Fusarium piperis TaxID=1435070 RepID=A0A9W8W6B1_9HYPO|nr:hypothetical protein N0V84_009388 [Fusarium piperis]
MASLTAKDLLYYLQEAQAEAQHQIEEAERYLARTRFYVPSRSPSPSPEDTHIDFSGGITIQDIELNALRDEIEGAEKAMHSGRAAVEKLGNLITSLLHHVSCRSPLPSDANANANAELVTRLALPSIENRESTRQDGDIGNGTDTNVDLEQRPVHKPGEGIIPGPEPAQNEDEDAAASQATITLTAEDLGPNMPDTLYKVSQRDDFHSVVRAPRIEVEKFDEEISTWMTPESRPDVKFNMFKKQQGDQTVRV